MKFNPYSISKIGTFTSCKRKFDFHYIQKIRIDGPTAIALQKGSYIHQVIEEDYNYNTPFKTNEIFTPEEKAKADTIIRTFENSTIGQNYKTIAYMDMYNSIHEEKFGLKIENSKVVICSYYDKDAWIRGAIDFQYVNPGDGSGDEVVAYNIDWKSGKDKSEDPDFGINQSMAYSIFLMLKFPNITRFVSKFVFIEHCTEKEIVYSRYKFNEYVRHFYNLTKEIENTEIFN